MLDLKNLIRKVHLPVGRKEQGRRENSTQTEITRLNSSRQFLVGRHLSFAIDSTSIQMAAVFRLGSHIRILDVSKAFVPRHDLAGDHRYNFLSGIIEEYIKTHGGYLPRISVTLTAADTAFRTFLMPALRKESLDSAIKFEVRKQIPYPEDNCIYDYRLTDRIKTKDRTRYKISLHASTSRNVYEHLKPFAQIDAKVNHVYHSQEVMGLLLERLPDFNQEQNYTLLCITKGYSTISFYHGTELQFFHVGTPGSTVLSDAPDQTQMEFFSESLVTEIRTAFDYYSGQFSGNMTNEILVYGDLANHIDLIDGLDSSLPYQFKPFPVEKLDFAADCKKSLMMSIAVCLPVLAASVCAKRTVNLLPAENRRQIHRKKWTYYGKTALAVSVICLSLGWAVLSDQVKATSASLLELQYQVVAFENSPAYHTYNNLKRLIAENRLYLDRAKQGQSYLGASLKEISLITPNSIKLLYYHLIQSKEVENLSLQGIVISKTVPPEIILAEYVESLSSSPFFDKVRIVRHAKKPLETGFEIEFVIDLRSVV